MELSSTGTNPSEKLVGRASELLCMQQLLAAAAANSVGAVAVLGEPGIGKTRLLDEVCKHAADMGFQVLTGRGSEFEREVPYGLVVEALDERFGVLDAEVVEALGPDRVSELAAVLPSLAGRGGQLASRLQVERFEFYRAVRATFERLCRSRPLLLALDDAHWADPASVELISYLLRRAVPGMVLALAYRPRQTPSLLLGAVEQAIRDGLLQEFELAPLTIHEAADLLSQRPDSPLVRHLYAESSGNPFYLEQLSRMARNDPASYPHSPGVGKERESNISTALRATLARELAVLPEDTLRVLQAAAVAGDPFDVDLIGEIAANDKGRVLKCLDALAAADLVRALDVAGSFRFRHPLVRRVVYDTTMPCWRFDAHKRAARALTQRGASLGTRAHHVERSATVGDDEAVATLSAAGHTVAARAPAAAAGLFEAALRLLPEASRSDRRLSLMVSLAGALASSGNLRESRVTLERALELIPADAPGDRVRIIGMIARADHGLGRAEEARRLITTALEQAIPGSADAVALRLDLAQNHLMMHEWERAVETTAHAREQAHVLGDPALLLASTATLAWLTSYQGSLTEANELIDLAADGMDRRDVDLPPALLEALADLVYAEMTNDRFRTADRHAERGLYISRTTGHGYAFGRFTIGAAAAKLFLGQLPEARTAVETAIETALLLDNDQLLSTAETLRCWVETLRGDLSAALAAGRAAVRSANRQPDALFSWLAHACYGEALIESGELERGRHEILSLGRPQLGGLPPTAGPFWHQALITVDLSVGRMDEAEALTQGMEATAVGPSRQGNACYARARVNLAAGDFTAAAASAHNAVERFETVEMAIWAARSRLLEGRSLRLAGAGVAAIRELEIAYAIFQDAGAERLRDECAKELRILGRRVRRQPPGDAPMDSPMLTKRERDIANRVAQGYTNREIAAELFVSPKTVEKHLARVFTKLGVSSRGGVATALNRHDAPR
ncbi:helix-turn-helix transcriptional regulator [Nocardia sp. CY41]|uniref:helix-turn-helix transcriptional regulator n=1 Tax=Nocardia sp. CY41 TaxID=2608686 RepID=UPI0013579D06|nr:LuxR family transcriptional regulator [Nocardia sp. CY41]